MGLRIRLREAGDALWVGGRIPRAQFGTGRSGRDQFPPSGRSAAYRRWPAPLIIIIVAAMLGGCALLADLASLRGRIEDAGYEVAGLNHETTNGQDVLTVEALTPDQRAVEDGDVEKIARIVWETYPRTVDVLNITINGRHASPIARDELSEAFGARDPALDKGAGLGTVLLIVLAIVLLAIMTIVTLIVVLVRRSRRARRATAQPYPPYRPGVRYPQVPPPAWPPVPAPPLPPPAGPQPPGRDE